MWKAGLRIMTALCLLILPSSLAQADALPGTEPLELSGDLHLRIIDQAHAFLDRKLAEAVDKRSSYWSYDFSDVDAYRRSVAGNRQRFRKIIGLVDERQVPRLEYFGSNAPSSVVGETPHYRIHQVRWAVLRQVWGEGLLLEPTSPPKALIVALPDADQTPEQLVGLAPGVRLEHQFARRLAEAGCLIVLPALVDRACLFSGNPQVGMTNQPHREWIYRQAFTMGRHIIGYEVQIVLSVIDWLKSGPYSCLPVGIIGYGEGGLIAFYAAAADERVDACLVSGYFDSRQRLWEEPIYRNVWQLLREFGDAEIASLITPRAFIVEYSATPSVDGPPGLPGKVNTAAPGRIRTPTFDSVRNEFARAGALDKGSLGKRELVAGAQGQTIGPGSPEALKAFLRSLGVPEVQFPTEHMLPEDRRVNFDPQARQERLVRQLEEDVQALFRQGELIRQQWFYGSVDLSSVDNFQASQWKLREFFREEIIGWLDDPLVEPAVRSRTFEKDPRFTAYEILIPVLSDLDAFGILCVPTDLRPGEKRPVVVCQHGLSGTPADTLDRNNPWYRGFARELAERGFVTFSPFHLYSVKPAGGDRVRLLRRKSDPLGLSYFSIIGKQHEQILRWLRSLPFVDAERIAFYGLSYGGVSAMKLPACLEGYCLSICSANFNDWIRKLVALDFAGSYMFHGEWEMFDFNLGNTFNYAEMGGLICPRPFMVERGHEDAVAPDWWVAYEYAKLRLLYTRLGLEDRTEIEFFRGGHEIHGCGTFQFLEKHLGRPCPPMK
ncbi:MAG: dienelactone hydrolase family protein [Thermoguttaceae bacterium]|nr:dienelactone hydrolase family protein [Thermoguttaceae bacterium]MDW8077269.1 dienelactone hydrolase family protein [Thermoguttaceae bacterium]